MKFLVDENLSARLAIQLQTEGFDVVHIRERGLLGATDPQVLEWAFNQDRILITGNVDDFVRLARARELHPGIILVEDGGLPLEEQTRVIRRALALVLAEQTEGRDMINRVVRIWLNGNYLFEQLPPPTNQPLDSSVAVTQRSLLSMVSINRAVSNNHFAD